MRRPPRSTLFPSTTLVRSRRVPRGDPAGRLGQRREAADRIAANDPIHGKRAPSVAGTDPQVRALAHRGGGRDRKSTRLNSSHANISYAVFCLKKKNRKRYC